MGLNQHYGPLRPGEYVTGSIPLGAWRTYMHDPSSDWNPVWLVLWFIRTRLEGYGIDPAAPLHITSHACHNEPDRLEWHAMAITDHNPNALRYTVDSIDGVRTLIDRDRADYGCTCASVLYRLLPTEKPDVYAIEYAHDDGCPAPARQALAPKITAN